ncbi:MAG TPA: hypothetical protein DC054_04775 [Blastocatellia bacterium]|nr:hypothetical protein [Blastocatellia bacterium]
MIICFDCSGKTNAMMDELLARGRYASVSELISIAIANQVVLETQVSDGESLTIGERESVKQKVSAANGKPSSKPTKKRRTVREDPDGSGQSHRRVEQKSVLFLLDGLDTLNRLSGSLPDDYWTPGMEVPLDRWVFGQHNKLLPVKASCRGLAHLLKDDPKGIFYDDAANRISGDAIILGDLLLECDGKHKIDRDKALSTAFPNSIDKSGKARSRYANQFVASVNKQGQVSGALIDFKLINYKPGKRPRLILTESGWEFALMRNPILDEHCGPHSIKFSEEEVKFFLNHIAANVRAEDFAYRAILQAIVGGANTPDLLDTMLRQSVPDERTQRVTLSFLSSQRSGAVSRMSDLGLVERVREGVRVTYLPTDLGRDFINRERPQE